MFGKPLPGSRPLLIPPIRFASHPIFHP
jgi:hypothetical protein